MFLYNVRHYLFNCGQHFTRVPYNSTTDPANGNNNGNCDPGEDCQSCPGDCAQVSGASCGNGLCEAGDGENCLTCAADCAGKQKGKNTFCCRAPGGSGNIGYGVDVNDTRCIDASANLFCRVTDRVSACCGDKLCEGAEKNISSCANDCDPNVCTPTEGTEVSCSDGQDNDCDGLIDSADPDCQVATTTTSTTTTAPATTTTAAATTTTTTQPPVVCEDISSRNACKAEPTCQWKKNVWITG